MKKLYFISTVILIAAVACNSTKKTTKLTVTAEPKIKLDQPLSTNNSLLWQISGNGLTKASYLFGTIHVIGSMDYFLGKNTEKKIKNADELIMEIDLNKVDVLKLAQLSMLPDNKKIKDYLSEKDYAELKKFVMDTLQINSYNFEESYARMKPFFLSELLFSKNMDDKVFYEMEIKKIADEKNIPQSGLETMTEQIEFLDEISIEDQLESILKTIRNYTAETTEFNQLVKSYIRQDLVALNKSFEADEDTLIKEKMVDKRNTTWIPKLRVLMQNKACFIAVGAGHLAGENGLINLLKKQGYTVEPVSIN